MSVSMFVSVYICMCMCMRMCICTCTCMLLSVCICVCVYSRGVGAVVGSLPFNPEVPDPQPGRGLNIWVTFFPTKVHLAFHPSGVGKRISAYMNRL